MADIFGIMSSASKALIVQQKAVKITGNNIANVNTPGYSRQRLNLSSDIPVNTSYGPIGTGVKAVGVERIYQRFLGVQINNETQSLGQWQAQKDTLERVEMVFDETGGYGLNQVMSEFWNGWQDLTNNPSGQVQRSVLSAKGEVLASTFNKVYQDLQTDQQEIDAMISESVDEINRFAEQIADLNLKIIQTESGGYNANDYRDQRDLALKELSERIGINSFEEADGGVSVLVGRGQTLVQGTHQNTISTQANANGLEDVIWVDSSNNIVMLNDGISGGKLRGWLDTRDQDIRNYLNRLDTLSQSLMDGVNSLHALGFDLGGLGGIDFFTGSATASGSMDGLLDITAEEGGAGNLSVTLVAGAAERMDTDPITGDIQITIVDIVSTRDTIAALLQSHSAIATAAATASGGTAWTLGDGTDTVTLAGGMSAAGIQVNSDIVNDTNLIAAASDPGDKPGDNRNAIAIANLQEALTMSGGTATFGSYYASLVSDVGHAVVQADSYHGHQSQMVTQLENYRESISGVSIDEEMVNLIKFQNAYQAAAKLISTADEMLQTVMNMV
jgi:flagellar hook-associated protein 1 FlgK